MNWLKDLLCKLFGWFCPEPKPPEPPIPPEPPEPPYPPFSPKPAWMPRLVLANLDMHIRAINWTDEDLDWFARQVGKNGIDYIRLFPYWRYSGKSYPEPFLIQPNDKYNFKKPNSEYNRQLKRVHNSLKRYGVGILFDFFDNCSSKQLWNPWYNNANGVKNIYDTSEVAIRFFKQWINRIINIIGVEGNAFGFGNELRYPNERKISELNEWVKKWAIPLAGHLISKHKIRLPIYYSGSQKPSGTGHKIYNRLIDAGYKYPEICQILHGQGLPEHFDETKDNLSRRKRWGISNDGWKKFVDTPQRAKLVKYAWEHLGNHLRIIEFMPRDQCYDQHIRDINVEKEIEVFPKIAMKVWGIKIKRW